MTAQALVTRSAAEPSEVRVWPRSDGIVLACRLRTRIPDGFWHRPRSQARRGSGISVGDATSMLDRYWRSERCDRSPWRPKLDRLAYVSPESAAPHSEMSISPV